MKNRIELAQHFAKLGFTKGVEVGVCDGIYSEKLMDNIPDLILYGIDPYTEYPGYPKERIEEKRRQAIERLSKYPNYILVEARSTEAAKLIPDKSIDFVFIDGAHDYESVMEDIKTWYPKVRDGGILSGHDYYQGKSGGMGVMEAVDKFIKATGLELQTTEWDEDAYVDDKQPDWFIQL